MSWVANGSLRAKMAVLLLGVTLLPLALVSTMDWRRSREQVLTGLQDVLQARSELLARELDAVHQGQLQAVDRLARIAAVRAFCTAGTYGPSPANPQAPVDQLLATLGTGDTELVGAGLIDRSGRVTAATGAAVTGLDLSQQPHVQTALQGGPVRISDVHLGVSAGSATAVVAYLAPIAGVDGQVACVVARWTRAASLWQRLRSANAQAGPGSTAVLLDAQGIRIGHAGDEEALFHPAAPLAPAELEAVVAQHRFGERTRALLEDVRPSPDLSARARQGPAPETTMFVASVPPAATANSAGKATADPAATGGPQYTVTRRLATVPWTVAYQAPKARVDEQLHDQLLNHLLLVLGVALLAYGGGLLVVRGIVR